MAEESKSMSEFMVFNMVVITEINIQLAIPTMLELANLHKKNFLKNLT